MRNAFRMKELDETSLEGIALNWTRTIPRVVVGNVGVAQDREVVSPSAPVCQLDQLGWSRPVVVDCEHERDDRVGVRKEEAGTVVEEQLLALQMTVRNLEELFARQPS